MILNCNSCGGTYPDTDRDGAPYYHACSPEVATHAVCDASGAVREPEKRTPRENCRDERLAPAVEGEAPRIVSEGAGRVKVSA